VCLDDVVVGRISGDFPIEGCRKEWSGREFVDVSPAGGDGGRAVMLRVTGRVERDSTASWRDSGWGSVGMRSRRVAGDDEDEDGEDEDDEDKLAGRPARLPNVGSGLSKSTRTLRPRNSGGATAE